MPALVITSPGLAARCFPAQRDALPRFPPVQAEIRFQSRSALRRRQAGKRPVADLNQRALECDFWISCARDISLNVGWRKTTS
jgi:hypothetical protein